MYNLLRTWRLTGRYDDAQIRRAGARGLITPEQAESIIAEAGGHDAVG